MFIWIIVLHVQASKAGLNLSSTEVSTSGYKKRPDRSILQTRKEAHMKVLTVHSLQSRLMRTQSNKLTSNLTK